MRTPFQSGILIDLFYRLTKVGHEVIVSMRDSFLMKRDRFLDGLVLPFYEKDYNKSSIGEQAVLRGDWTQPRQIRVVPVTMAAILTLWMARAPGYGYRRRHFGHSIEVANF
jgi:hypothetical protein